MSNYALGKTYEGFVEMVYQAILEAERRNNNVGQIKLERRKNIISKSGTPAEIDIYWEYTIAGITNCVAIECKNYNKNVDIPSVRDFARKISDVSGLKGLIVTKMGFSANAVAEATADNIDLLVIRELAPEDLSGRLTRVDVRLHALSASRTIKLSPRINKEWAVANGYKAGEQISYSAQNNLLWIEDVSLGTKHTLLELEQNDFFEQKGVGTHVWLKTFTDAWIYFDTIKLKLDSIEVQYQKPPITTTEFSINLEQYVLAVMEYINGQKGNFIVLTSGDRKEI